MFVFSVIGWYGRYGQKSENGRTGKLFMCVEIEPSTADMAKIVETAVQARCFCKWK